MVKTKEVGIESLYSSIHPSVKNRARKQKKAANQGGESNQDGDDVDQGGGSNQETQAKHKAKRKADQSRESNHKKRAKNKAKCEADQGGESREVKSVGPRFLISCNK